MNRLVAFALLLGCFPVTEAHANGDQDLIWDQWLRESFFQDRPIVESDDIIELKAPPRAADPAVVPVSIEAKIAQSADRYIERITLLIDQNPAPLAGKFTFTAESGRADVSMRIRMNAFSAVRAVAELNDGTLHMSQRFVKASGGCSAPLTGNLEKALARMGKMKLKISGLAPARRPLPTQLRISHPNVTGLQLDQVNNKYLPAHFIQHVEVSFEGRPIFTAETDISISADPSFEFYFVPPRGGNLVANVTDNTGNSFSKVFSINSRE